MSINTELVIETIPLSKLTPASYNPRAISDAAFAGLKSSLSHFGYVDPIIWNKTTENVVGGHQRLFALQQEKVKEVKVVVVELPEAEEKALNVTLNNQHIAGNFTADLGDVLAEIELHLGDDFDDLRLDLLSVDFTAPDPEPADEPAVADGVTVEIVATSDEYNRMAQTLEKWGKRDGVSVHIS